MKSLFIGYSVLCMLSLMSLEIPDKSLFKCNFQKLDVANLCNIEKELEIFSRLAETESIYAPMPNLEGWICLTDRYPDIHIYHRKIVDTIKDLRVASVCEFGAGAGRVAKYVYAENPNLSLLA
jgi:hypothetical protein